MLDRDDKKQKIVDLLQSIQLPDPSVKPPRKRRPPASKPPIEAFGAIAEPKPSVIYVGGNGNAVAGGNLTQTISGGTNFIGNQGNVHLQIGVLPRSRSRPPSPQPGPEHIGEEQKRVLQDLCKDWIDLHRNLKQRELTYSSAWSRINKAAGSVTYHLILRERFEDACTFMRQEMAILRAMRSAPAKDLAWRSSRITAIKVRSKKQLGDPDAYKAYIKKNFKAESLTDLATDELQKTYSYIMAKKAA